MSYHPPRRRPDPASPPGPPFHPELADRLAGWIESAGRLFRHTPEAVLGCYRGRLLIVGGRLRVVCAPGTSLSPAEELVLRVNGPDLVRLLTGDSR